MPLPLRAGTWNERTHLMKYKYSLTHWTRCLGGTVVAFTLATISLADVRAADKKPNVVFIMGDDVGWFNIGAYHRGMMAGRTPNLDTLAKEGMLFTDYYAEASCTAGRANF